MPVYFFVGGFANAVSWRAAARARSNYRVRLRVRVRRLVLPGLHLLTVWTAGALAVLRGGLDAGRLNLASQAALVAGCVLAPDVAVVAFPPLTLAAWDRWGWASVLFTGVGAGLVDLVSLGWGITWVGYLNYLLMWGTVHSLGYAWADSRLG